MQDKKKKLNDVDLRGIDFNKLQLGQILVLPCGCQAKVAKVAWSKREETIIVPFKMCRRHKPRR